MVGLGGLYVSLTASKPGTNARTLLLATACASIAAFAATLIGNYAILSVALLFLVAFALGGMTTLYKQTTAQIGFTTTMVFAVMLGLPGEISVAAPRLAQIALGGLWATGLTLLLWRARPDARPAPEETTACETAVLSPLSRFRDHLTLASPTFQHRARLGLAVAIAAAIYKPLHLPHGPWLTIAVLAIVKPDHVETRKRAADRIWGTIAGGVLAVALAHIVTSTLAADLALALLCVLAFSHLAENYTMFVTFLTPFVVLLLHLAAPNQPLLAGARIIDTIVGGALAFAIAYFLRVRPTEAQEEAREAKTAL